MAYIRISSRNVPNHPEWHPGFLYEELNETAIADIRRRLSLGAQRVVVEVIEDPDSTGDGIFIKVK